MLIVGLMVVSSMAAVPMGGATGDATVQTAADRARTTDVRVGSAGARGFVENLGQLGDDGISFYLDSRELGVAFLESAVLMDLRSASSPRDASIGRDPLALRAGSREDRFALDGGDPGCVVRLDFVGADPVRPEGRDPLPGACNFMRGRDPAQWHLGARAYSEVVYAGLYPGVDLVYRAMPEGVKYEFLVAPGADPSTILVHAEGQSSLTVDGGTTLVIDTCAGRLVDAGLLAFHGDGPVPTVACGFVLRSPSSYAFCVGPHDASRPLVIDPLLYSTYLGGRSNDLVYDVKVDPSDGTMYLGGTTLSRDFPTTAGAYQGALRGTSDATVTKLTADGSALVFSTFIGGSAGDSSQRLDIDSSGNVYLVGYTESDDFPVSAGAIDTDFAEGDGTVGDGYVCKLGPKGDSIVYATYIGGTDQDLVTGIDVDSKQCAHIVGLTYSYDFNVTEGALKSALEGFVDAFVCALNSDGTAYSYSTYLGGESSDYSDDIVVDSDGSAYVCGGTYSSDFPVTSGAYAVRPAGNLDAYVAKLATDGKSMVWATFLGGTSDEEAMDIALDASGQPVVVGDTDSRDFPVTAGSYQTHLASDDADIFVTTLSADATSLKASTFLGGDVTDVTRGVCLGPEGDVLICGGTSSSDFPTTAGAERTGLSGDCDAIVSSLSSDLRRLTYSTYLGGSTNEIAYGIAHDAAATTYVVGYLDSTDLAVTAGAFQAHNGGEVDGFLCKLIFDSVPPIAEAGDDVTIDQHQSVELNGSRSSDNLQVVNWTWTFRYNGSDVALYGPVRSFRFDVAGRYSIALSVTDLANLKATDRLNVTVRDITRPVADAGQDRLIDQHERIDLDGTRSSDNVGVVNLTWTFVYGGEDVTLKGSGPSFTFDDAGTYVIELNVSDAMGNWATDTMTVIVKDVTAPTADAGADAVVDQHASVAFDGSGCRDNVGIVNYTWSFVCGGQPVTLYGPAASYVFDIAGKYTVTLAVSDEMGNVASDAMTVEVLDTTPPTAEAGPDATILQGQPYRFDGRGSQDNVAVGSWTWRFDYWGVPIMLEGHDPQFVFELAGAYAVTLTVTDNAGNFAEDTMTLTVKDLEAPVAVAGGDVEIDQHHRASFDASLSTDNLGIVNWTWMFDCNGSRVELHGATASYLFDDAGSYEVDLVVVDAAGNHASDKLNVTVRDTTPPRADAGGDLTIEQGSRLALDGRRSTDNVAIASWAWTFTYEGTPIRLLGRTQNFTFERPGTYNVTLTVEDAEGLSDATTIKVKVRDSVDPTVVAPGHLTVKAGDRVTLDGSGSTDNVGVVSWEWTFRDGGKDVKLNGSTVRYAFKDKGDHTVALTAYDAEGNAATTTFKVTVKGGSALLYVALLAVVLVVVAVALIATRRRAQ